MPHIHCPANGWDCPYWVKGLCTIGDPLTECDDFGFFYKEGEDYFCDCENNT